jgi:hypothetical protein
MVFNEKKAKGINRRSRQRSDENNRRAVAVTARVVFVINQRLLDGNVMKVSGRDLKL